MRDAAFLVDAQLSHSVPVTGGDEDRVEPEATPPCCPLRDRADDATAEYHWHSYGLAIGDGAPEGGSPLLLLPFPPQQPQDGLPTNRPEDGCAVGPRKHAQGLDEEASILAD